MPRVVTERIGTFRMLLRYDARGRLLEATRGPSRLTLSPRVPSGERRGPDGSERWSDGKVTGTWTDAPYGHENDVDRTVSFEEWSAESLRDMRRAVFACGRDGGPPETAGLARRVVAYAVRHDLLRRNLSFPAAEEVVRLALPSAPEKQRREWLAYFATRGMQSPRTRDV